MQLLRLLLCTGLILAFPSLSQAQVRASVFTRDTGNHYHFERTVTVPGASRAVLYNRMRRWVPQALEPSDSYLDWDESGQQTISTLAFLMMKDSRNLRNQLLSFKVQLYVEEGRVTMTASDFIYHAVGANGREMDLRPEDLARIGDRQGPVEAAIDLSFARLSTSFERAVKGR